MSLIETRCSCNSWSAECYVGRVFNQAKALQQKPELANTVEYSDLSCSGHFRSYWGQVNKQAMICGVARRYVLPPLGTSVYCCYWAYYLLHIMVDYQRAFYLKKMNTCFIQDSISYHTASLRVNMARSNVGVLGFLYRCSGRSRTLTTTHQSTISSSSNSEWSVWPWYALFFFY